MLKQQTQKIEVIVRKEGGNGEKGNKEADVEDVGGKAEEPRGGISKATRRKVLTNFSHAAAVSRQWFNAQMNYQIQALGQISGDEALQNQVGRQMEYVQDRLNLATSTAMGAVYGSFGGLPGMLIGATLGFASSAILTNYKYANRERDFNFKLFKENNAIEYKRARASINLTTGRLR